MAMTTSYATIRLLGNNLLRVLDGTAVNILPVLVFKYMSDVFIYQDPLTSRTYLSICNNKDTDVNKHRSEESKNQLDAS